MKCKNPYCNATRFTSVIETDNNSVIGLKCMSCNARYSLDDDIEIKKSLKRIGWNSVKWKIQQLNFSNKTNGDKK